MRKIKISVRKILKTVPDRRSRGKKIGRFPIEIKTKIRYDTILPYELMIATNFMISYFGFDFDRKSTYSLIILYEV